MTPEQKAATAVQLHARGFTFQQIADELGYSGRQAAEKAYRRGQKALPPVPGREDLIAQEAKALNDLQAALWPEAMKGDTESARTVLTVMARRAKMFGLDAPTKVEQRVTSELDQEIERMLGELAGHDVEQDSTPG